MSKAFINCEVISLAKRSKKYHGFLVENGKIVCLEDYDRIMEDSNEKINLQGYTVLPGFIDSHTHLMKMGFNMNRIDLSDTDSLEEAKYYLEKAVNNKNEEDWIVGIDYDDSKWKKVISPTKEDLDEVSDEHPIVMIRVCGHVAIANSLALEQIDDDMDMVDFEKGIMKEEAVWNLDEIMKITKIDRINAIKRGMKKAHSLGVTGIHEIVDRKGWEAYKQLDKEGELNLRTRCYIHHEDADDLTPVTLSDFLSLRGVKFYADGSLGARTAALEEEYGDDSGNNGILLHSKEEMEKIINSAEEKDFQVMVHAIGDRAINTVLDAYESTAEKTKKLRHRIEHAEMLWGENIRRIRYLNLILSAQPNFAYKWSQPNGMNERRLGEERLQKCDPFWDAQRSLVKMTFGSDTMPMSPLFGVYSAVNHPILEQRISTYNALQSYITNGAYASRDEDKFGQLTEGRYADFVVLSENPLDADDLLDIEVKMTVINGEIVYSDF
ncbi:MAG: amidohydrolase [Thermoplasmatota archaeon]